MCGFREIMWKRYAISTLSGSSDNRATAAADDKVNKTKDGSDAPDRERFRLILAPGNVAIPEQFYKLVWTIDQCLPLVLVALVV
ncbi:hypothetical protein EBB07_30455 [Paenibacillaceae bacterium]|nr:hypothetical protein EBB07_30455 [Paenibacillaceae bacterium]